MNISFLIDLFMHLDRHLSAIVGQYHTASYVLLFLLIFCETGLVVTPFLPGDSLIFATGALIAAGGPLNIPTALLLFCIAAIGGDTVNYQIGRLLREKVQKRQKIRFIKLEHIDRTHRFFEKHGGKTIIIARFIPIIRTFAPFVAGVGTMSYRWFLSYNVIGGISWVALFFSIGFFFGNLPFIKSHFSLIVLAIIFISVLPAAFVMFRNIAAKHAKARAL